ncbi:MAG: hypothetical protein ABEK59_12330 [Halobacteria archaeon]
MTRDLLKRRSLLKHLSLAGTLPVFTGCTSLGNSGFAGNRGVSAVTGPLKEVRAGRNRFVVKKDGGWKEILLRGVNLGRAIPGKFPGNSPVGFGRYRRWLNQISLMDANVVRLFTVHPPEFYRALSKHNRETDRTIYLLQGTWLPPQQVTDGKTAYEGGTSLVFDERLELTVDAVNGGGDIPHRPDHAGGSFDVDVSNYCLGYVAGLEWKPGFVSKTDREHEGGGYRGGYVYSDDGSTAFERWLAKRLDRLVEHLTERYGHQRPVSFINWPPTGPLGRSERQTNGSSSINPNHVASTEKFESGVFTTFSAYPYYPDFLAQGDESRSRDGGYGGSKETSTSGNGGDGGSTETYKEYIRDLVEHIDNPLFVAEFGVPSSRGIAHRHSEGLDQGHNTETEQGKIDGMLFQSVMDAGCAGGALFSWQDEWYKSTWNTEHREDEWRRPFWLNVESPEQEFGILAFEPKNGVSLSGKTDEWEDTERLAVKNGQPHQVLDDGYDEGRNLRELRMTSDESYLNFRIKYSNLGKKVDWSKTRTVVTVKTTPGMGNHELPGVDVESEQTVDFAVVLGGPSNSRLLVASHYDPFYYLYGEKDEYIERKPYASKPENGVYHPVRLATQLPEKPVQEKNPRDQGEADIGDIFRYVETGKLRYGNGDPSSSGYDSLTDVHVDTDDDTVEFRIPWMNLNFRDPSTRTVQGNFWKQGIDFGRSIDGIEVAVLTYRPEEHQDNRDGAGETIAGETVAGETIAGETVAGVTDVLAGDGLTDGQLDGFLRYSWDDWKSPGYTERLKKSYGEVREVYGRYSKR